MPEKKLFTKDVKPFDWKFRQEYQKKRIIKQIAQMEKMGKGDNAMKLKSQKLRLDAILKDGV